MNITKFLDVRRIILVVLIIVFLITFLNYGAKVPIEKRCSTDSDCGFVKTVCCPNCAGGIESMNTKYINEVKSNLECSDTECPPLFCNNNYGESYTTTAVCMEGICETIDELNCNAVCTYVEKINEHPSGVYVLNVAQFEGIAMDDVAGLCEC